MSNPESRIPNPETILALIVVAVANDLTKPNIQSSRE
jgi:hypothetical protein